MNDTTDAKPESQSGGEAHVNEALESITTTDETDSKATGAYRSSGRLATMSESEFLSQHYTVKDFIGHAVIINNKDFDIKTGMSSRKGTDADADNMQSLLTTMGFQVDYCNNLTIDKMQMKLQNAASDTDHTNSSCFVCVILSHGEEGYVYGTDNRLSLDDLVAPFKGDVCPSLAGKPKIFFIQACKAPDPGYEVEDGLGGMDTEMDKETLIRRIPTEADFLIALSVVPGCFVWEKSPKKSSWFIDAIYNVFNRNWQNLDLMTMMTRVNKIVADEFEKKASIEFSKRKKQIPCITSMLVKDVYFFKK